MITLYAGNLPGTMTEKELRALFSPFGSVLTVTVAVSDVTGHSKGFAYIDMPNPAEARAAIAALNNRRVHGRDIIVIEAQTYGDHPQHAANGWSL